MEDREKTLEGKKILIVDDERDVLETLEDLLSTCRLVKATTFEEGKHELESQDFDLAILDIMGVNGYKLLEIAKKRGVIPVMLHRPCPDVEDTVKSFKSGAASFVPKDEIARIASFLRRHPGAKKRERASVPLRQDGNLPRQDVRIVLKEGNKVSRTRLNYT